MKLFAFVLVLLLSACTLQTDTEPTSPSQQIANVEALVITATPETTVTRSAPTRPNTRTRTPTRTATPTRTSTMTPTFTATPTERPTRDVFQQRDTLGNTRRIPRQEVLNLQAPPPGMIAPTLFGINYWKGPFNRPVRQALEPLNFTVMRWGGQNYENEPIEWSNLDRFIEECRKSNAEPLIQVPFWSITPEFAAKMVQYVNVTKKYDVRFWSISNEPDKNQRRGSLDRYIQGFRAFRDAMKAVDPKIKLFGPELATEYNLNDPSRNWLTPFLLANGDIVDVVSLHRYPFGGTTRWTKILVDDAFGTAARVNQLREHIRSVTGRDIPLAFTEMNLSHDWTRGGEGSSAGFAAGLWLAETMGQMAETGVTMVNVWNAHSNDTLGLITSDRQQERPTYFALLLYANYGDRVVPLASHVPDVSAHASLDSRTNYTSVVIINRAAEPKQFQIVFNSNEEQRDGGIYMDRGSVKRMDLTAPAESMGALMLDTEFKVVRSIVYSREMFNANQGAKITNNQP